MAAPGAWRLGFRLPGSQAPYNLAPQPCFLPWYAWAKEPWVDLPLSCGATTGALSETLGGLEVGRRGAGRMDSGTCRAPALHLPGTLCILGTWQDAEGAQLRTEAGKFGGGRGGCQTEKEEEKLASLQATPKERAIIPMPTWTTGEEPL